MLKLDNVRVVTKHYRAHPSGEIKRYERSQAGFGDQAQPEPKGGRTEVAIYTDSEDRQLLASAVAECSKKDTFCYKRGFQIAFGRAMKKLT